MDEMIAGALAKLRRGVGSAVETNQYRYHQGGTYQQIIITIVLLLGILLYHHENVVLSMY